MENKGIGKLGANVDAISSGKLGTTLFLVSFATVFFTLTIFKLLSFFIMPSLFFDLLFIGFPVGAMIGTAYFSISVKSFVKTLWLLVLALIVSVLASLFSHHFDYLRIHLFDVEVSKLLINIGIFTALFTPFFIAYGLCEYIGYQLGRKHFASKMRLVYAIYLFGAAAAYGMLHWIFPHLGVAKSLLMTLLILLVAGLLVSKKGRQFKLVSAKILIVGAIFFVPNMEGNFLSLFKGISPSSTRQFESNGLKPVFQKWGRYSLCEILATPDGSAFYGFYNDFFQWEYYPKYGFHTPSLGAVPMKLVEPDSKIAIIGSGGGRQVRYASIMGHSDVTAVEIEPAVIDAVQNEKYLKDEFKEVYDTKGVTLVNSEGRKFLEESDVKYDLIFLPSVGGYPQMMLEPGNLIRTIEAYRTIGDKLSNDGYFAIWYPVGLDEKGILTDQYVRTLLQLDMNVKAFKNAGEFLILARKNKNLPIPAHSGIAQILGNLLPQGATASESTKLPRGTAPYEYKVGHDSEFKPVTDNRPFLGGNLSHIFSTRQVVQLYGTGALILLLAGIGIWILLRKKGDPRIKKRSYGNVMTLSFLLGANFLLIEHLVVLSLFQANFVYYDALITGAIAFLILSGIGSMISIPKVQKPLMVIGIITLGTGLVLQETVPSEILLFLMVPSAIAAGMFFPTLFDSASDNPLGVFAFDAVGAGLGSLLAASIPLLFGFKVYGYIAVLIFTITVIYNLWFHILKGSEV